MHVCTCCALMIANDDDSGCKDFHEHQHEHQHDPASLIDGLVSLVIPEDGADLPVRYFDCDGCGDVVMDHYHEVVKW